MSAGIVDHYWDDHLCSVEATCANTFGAYNCTCNEGWTGDGFNCTDIDECLEDDPCDMNAWCNNTLGSFECYCNEGYYGDGFACADSDECGFFDQGTVNNVTDALWMSEECDMNAQCSNLNGTYNCTCDPGYEGDGFNCTNIDECAEEIDECSEFADCTDTDGSYNCTCWLGYDGDGFNCTEVDECTATIIALRAAAPDHLVGTIHFCDDDAFCTNTDGGYNCTCNDGYDGDGFNCTDVDECIEGIDNCDQNAWCNNTIGAFECYCNDGWFGDGIECADSDECAENDSPLTVANVTDFLWDSNECHEDGYCSNTLGGYNCTCNDGYEGDGFNCTNIDECFEEIDECSEFADCTDTDGSYNCTCWLGYDGDGFNCTEVDECLATINALRAAAPDHLIGEYSYCDEDATCTNTDGGYNCTCNDGYFGSGFNCTDSDECAEMPIFTDNDGFTDPLYDSNECSMNGYCTNTIGGYNCTCDDGYRGDGFNCTNIDECAEELDECSEFADCIDTDGGYNCTCWLGYDGDGFNCTEVDECTATIEALRAAAPDHLVGTIHYCHDDAFCTNTDGGYNCTCNDGYEGDGFNCTDVDECLEGIDNCDVNAWCNNTIGAFECYCNDGWFGDGIECADSDECAENDFAMTIANVTDMLWDSNECHEDGFCTNTLGGYNCTCNDGYTGDGFNCTNINECAEEIDECSEFADCTDTDGSYNCTCWLGYNGDGFNCTEVDECTATILALRAAAPDNLVGTIHFCDDEATCTNTDGGYNCTCDEGFFGSGFNCTDSDECAEMPIFTDEDGYTDPLYDSNECSMNGYCTNTFGGYNCTCDDGYRGDGFNCTNIDECAEELDECSEYADCTDTDGGYNCTCWLGYDGDGFNCTEVDECTATIIALRAAAPDHLVGTIHFCDDDATCTNTDGGYNCTCNDGYEGDGFNCTDIDECTEELDNCDENAWCNNTIGGFECYCNDGWYGDGVECADSDECAENDFAMALANITDPLWDSNECHQDGYCTNTLGGYNCTCDDGYEGDGFNCTNIDECFEQIDDCSEFADCTDTDGSYNCTCFLGYNGDGFNCTEVDECLATINALRAAAPDHLIGEYSYCDAEATCTNTAGGYNCTCDEGFYGSGFNCSDSDECAEMSIMAFTDADGYTDPLFDTNMCSEDAYCTNTWGSYNCTCNDGFRGDGFNCTDIDECLEGTDECHEMGATCMNFDGGYNCTCDFGFFGDGFNCSDSDECGESMFPVTTAMVVDPLYMANDCSPQAMCANTYGAYNCSCEDGFEGDGFNCTDIDECLEGVDNCDENAWCNNTFGGFECYCNDGWFGDGVECADSDECAENDSPMSVANVTDPLWDSNECHDNGFCTNSLGGYNCTCNDGYEGDGFNCTNIDECAEEIDECSEWADCTDTDGFYNCTCWLGYEGDGFNCTEIDECTMKILELRAMAPPELVGQYQLCHNDAMCTNTDGGYNCTCDYGFFGSGFNCTDSDECAENAIFTDMDGYTDELYDSNECDENAMCSNTYGGYNCTCVDGYRGDGFNCTNIDECAEELDMCSEFADCTDTDGGYNCTCWLGYSGDGFNCTEVDECTATIEALRAAAPDHLVGSIHYCHEDAFCTNTDGGYNCTCNEGYEGDGFNCTDVDECMEGLDNCNENAWCNNTIGSFECYCNPGWFGDGVECADSDECAENDSPITVANITDPLWDSNECHDNGFCTNSLGGYNCTCNDGYEGDGYNCTNIDECMEEIDECSEYADCTDTDGSYNCTCWLGYEGDGFNCTEIDECTMQIMEMRAMAPPELVGQYQLCHDDAICTNTDGGYNCTCEYGFFGSGFNCSDSDECAEMPIVTDMDGYSDDLYDSNECDENAMCSNTYGGYNCTCMDGYRGDGFNCTNIDECAEELDECSEFADCTDTDGGYNCTCWLGYSGDGFNCTEVDECTATIEALRAAAPDHLVGGIHYCHDDAFCTNTDGGYNCTCNEGFRGDGFNCTEIDECAEGLDNCDENAWCNNTIGAFECYCDFGWFGDGFECADSDECAENDSAMTVANVTDPLYDSNECHADGFCTNSLGGYNCTCNDGYEGDGYNCTNIDECAEEIDECSEYADCTDTDGSYNCTCWLGYEGDGFNCTEIDECNLKIMEMRAMAPPELVGQISFCDDDAFCTNTDGGYNCTCNMGFFGDGFNCTDSDECAHNPIITDMNGYTDDLYDSNECHPAADCINTHGGYNCTCFDGYRGDGFDCEDIDECAEETDECHDLGATCINLNGSYTCECDYGFFGDGFNCSDSNECGDDSIVTTAGIEDPLYFASECDVNAACTNTYGEF